MLIASHIFEVFYKDQVNVDVVYLTQEVDHRWIQTGI